MVQPIQNPVYAGEPFEITALNADFLSSRAAKYDHSVEMIWLTKGRFSAMIDLEAFEVSEGMILFQAPGRAFYFGSSSDPEGLVVRFPTGVIPADVNSTYPSLSYCTSRLFQVDALTAATIMSAIQCMQLELATAHSQKTDVLSGYLRIVLLYLARQKSVAFSTSFGSQVTALTKRFFDLLERKYHVNKKVSQYADELAVTPNYLNQIIKQETGMTASANIRKRLLIQAKRMALVQNTSMKAVAYKLGFEDTAHFSKFFKVGCGCSFTDYRKSCPNT
ncbi:AraC family transcriptional regulator [Dyadobacter beijingensis]|uniref:AraC family transcriptional regulator n=1 Tax=Dyadobacter beijingensis TaxID=365489 RepID=UPI001E349528|nr:helix-turn-helix domain-containing protein [Dyadobacter beijingensis]